MNRQDEMDCIECRYRGQTYGLGLITQSDECPACGVKAAVDEDWTKTEWYVMSK